MKPTYILALSFLIQVVATLAALWLVRVTGKTWASVLVALAIGLMTVRRGVTLYRAFTGDATHPPDVAGDCIGLAISMSLLAGLILVGPILRTIRQAERARAEATARFRHLSETTREGVVIHESGRLRECNSAFANLLGYTREEVIGMEVSRFIAPESAALVARHLREDFDQPYEHLALRKNGTTVPVEVCGKTTHIQDRAVRVTTVRDITARKQTEAALRAAHDELETRVHERTADLEITKTRLEGEVAERTRVAQALRESETRFRLLCASAPIGIFLTDASGATIYANPRLLEIAGLTEAQAMGWGWLDSIHPDHRGMIAVAAQDAARSGAGFNREFRLQRHDGGVRWIHAQNARIEDDNGVLVGKVGTVEDVTERVRAAKAMQRAKEQAEAADRAKSVFLANMSHELRTPIMAMLGAAELSRPQSDAETAWRRRNVILRNGRHLLSLVDSILDLTRLHADRIDMRPAECALLDIMADVRAVALPESGSTNVEFLSTYETPVPSRVRTDAMRVKQAIINLVHNAIKFTRRGHVHMRVRVEVDDQAANLVVVLDDTGPGIAPDALERIFEPFAQLEPASGTITEGVGLGLPLARAFARQLGGDVTVESTPGQGSRFTLSVRVGLPERVEWIPAETANRVPLVGASHPYECDDLKLRGTVLLAEDARDTRELIREALAHAGVDITAVADGKQAVNAANHRQFDLILMDVRMPQMDGLTAARLMRRNGSTSPLVALTASTTGTERARILEAGFDDFWPKPISLGTLLQGASAYLQTAPSDGLSTPTPGADDDTRHTTTFHERFTAAVAEFAASLPDRVDEIKRLVHDGQQEQAGAMLHQLAGSGGIHGFMSVSEEAARLVQLARDGTLRTEGQLTSLAHLAVSIAGLGQGGET